MADSSLSNAQKASLNSLRHVAALAVSIDGYLVRVGEPEVIHPGMQQSSVLVKVEAWDPRVPDGEAPKESVRTFLVEPGGCIARLAT